jgi:hypothetical protein
MPRTYGSGIYGPGIYGLLSPVGVPRAQYVVEAAWGQGSTGLFRFGISTFGSTADRLAADSWSAAFTGPYDNMTAAARTIGITRGRDNDISQFAAGQLTLSMRDASGIYNPYNTTSPLVSAGNLDTDKPIRISAILAGVTYRLYYGFITDIEGDPAGGGTVQITAADFLDKLDRQSPILTGLAGGLTDGQLVGLILDWFQWTDPAMRNLAVGDTISAAYTRADGSRTGLALVAELMEAERGLVFVAANGAVTYLDRHARYAATSLATIDRTLKAFPAGRSNANVINKWIVQRTDMAGTTVGVAQTWSDAASIRLHGEIAQTITTSFLNNDNQALSLAQYLVNRTKSGIQLVYEIPLSIPDQATLIQALSREIGDRVTLTIAPRNMPQITGNFYIEAIAHAIQTSGPPRHATTWRVSQAPTNAAFRFGVSRFGGADVLGY